MTDAPDHATIASGQDAIAMLRRWWWLVAIAFVMALAIGYVLTPPPPWTSDFRATVLIPGDTEDTGSSERPELMVLDDLGPFVGSWVFADAIATELDDDTDDVFGMISGTRYSRVATVTVAGSDRDAVRRVAEAAAAVFPAQVNAFLVAPGADAATIQIIDPPSEPARDLTMRWVRVGAIGLLGATAAAVVLVLLTPGRRGDGVPGA